LILKDIFKTAEFFRLQMEWLKESGYGGVMVYAIDMDDFSGRCGAGKYPLLNTLNTELDGYKVELEYDGPYESYNPNGKYTTKNRKSRIALLDLKCPNNCLLLQPTK
jgi:chitinase